MTSTAERFSLSTGEARPAARPLEVEKKRHGDAYLIVKLEGELDLATAADAEAEIVAALMSKCMLIIVDLSDLAFIDRAGIAALVRAGANSSPDSGRLVFVHGSSWAVQRLVNLCGADRELKFID
jgi:anti-anti-sigma factor